MPQVVLAQLVIRLIRDDIATVVGVCHGFAGLAHITIDIAGHLLQTENRRQCDRCRDSNIGYLPQEARTPRFHRRGFVLQAFPRISCTWP